MVTRGIARLSKRWIAVVVGVGLLMITVGAFFTLSFYLRPAAPTNQFRIVYIPPGFKAVQIADSLAEKKIIRSRLAFLIWTKVSGKQSHLWAGYYNLSPHFSSQFVLKILTEHTPYSRLVRVTIPEGFSIRQIGDALESKHLGRSDEFEQYVRTDAKMELLSQFPWMVMIPTRNLEGVLYPDTYLFPPSASRRMIVKAMLAEFSRQILPIWNVSSADAKLSFYNSLVMASMIEKEAVVSAEMPTIASVFFNRLNKNMTLASDPTVVYALGMDWKSRVLYKDLKVDSPYNTYIFRGLPPTPIASPGLRAIKAVLHPTTSSYLFFVADKRNEGHHVFTTNYRDHLEAQL